MKNKVLYSGEELYKLALNLSQEYRPNKSSLDRRKRDGKFYHHCEKLYIFKCIFDTLGQLIEGGRGRWRLN